MERKVGTRTNPVGRNSKKLNIIKSVIFFFLCIMIAVGIIVMHEIKHANVYGETYYATLVPMYEKLEKTEGKKIVIIGNSSIPFGVDSQLFNELLEKAGYEYTVCNFGLYGSIGTKAMMELAKDTIKSGDIIIFMPEAQSQSQSMYFSASELWYALESRKSLIFKLDKEARDSMYANYPKYVSERNAAKEAIIPLDIYAFASFDDNLNLKKYERSVNIMQDMADENSRIKLDEVLLSADYIDFINSYYADILKKGASMYFAYGPMNEQAIDGNVDDYCQRVKEGYAFPVIGDFRDSAMEADWFYDSNFHLNNSGMTVFTLQLFNNLKMLWKDTSVTEYSLPQKPSEERPIEIVSGDSKDENCFEYEEKGEGYRIIGLTEAGKNATSLTIPVSHDGKPVNSFAADTFTEAKKLKELTLQANIKSIPDYSFKSCSSLKKLVLKHDNPQDISVGYHLLGGSSAKVYVPETSKNAFKNNYFWGNYAEVIQGYE